MGLACASRFDARGLPRVSRVFVTQGNASMEPCEDWLVEVRRMGIPLKLKRGNALSLAFLLRPDFTGTALINPDP